MDLEETFQLLMLWIRLAHYEVSSSPKVSDVQMLFKTYDTGGGDFEVRRDTAFAALEGSVTTISGGFVATSYQAVYASRL
jgi:hypothetical protein